MKAVFKHELSTYFTSLMGYVFGAFLLLFAGIYTMVVNVNSRVVNFEYVFGNMAFIFLIIVPILTMRTLAEERRQKTDQLLYALPISMVKVVLGKYFAMLVMLLLPMVIICLYPLLFSAYGSMHLPTALTAAFGFFMLGAALLSIGMFLSSVTENQAVAAGASFVVMLLLYYMSTLAGYVPTSAMASVVALSVVVILLGLILRAMTKNSYVAIVTGMVLETGLLLVYILKSEVFEGLFSGIVSRLSLFERFYVFVYGIFDLVGLVFFLSVIVLFLFLSVQSMEKRRWSE